MEALSVRLMNAPMPDGSNWSDGEVDYVKSCELTPTDIPELIALAQRWCDDDYQDEYIADDEQADKAEMLPVIAWRGLGQLKATEAIDPLIEMINPLDADNDEWFLLDFPRVFSLIGSTAIEPLSGFFTNGANSDFARTCASECMRTIAQRDPRCRDQVIGILESELKKFQPDAYGLHALVVADMLDLHAVECLGSIEQIHARDLIDVSMNGGWPEVCRELGVEVTDTKMPKPPYDEWPSSASPTFAVAAAIGAFDNEEGEFDFDLLREGIDTLSKIFSRSPEFVELDEEFFDWPRMFLELAASYRGVNFLSIALVDAEEVLFNVFPRKVSCSPDSADQVVVELRQFFRFVDRKFETLHAASLADLFDTQATAKELRAGLADSSKFGMAKSLFTQASDAGFDITNHGELEEFMMQYNASINPDLPSTATGHIGMTTVEKKAFNKKRKKQLANKMKKKKKRR